MKKIAVTGAAGFIGQALVSALVDAGFRVSATDLKAYDNRPLGVKWVQGDLRDSTVAASALEGADLCIALAGMGGGVGYFSLHPASILRDNLLIIAQTLDSCLKNRVCRIVFTSSSCVFSRDIEPPFREEDVAVYQKPLPPGYPFSKLAGEMLCQSYQEEYGLTFTIVRPFNVYGPGDVPGPSIGEGHVIPELTARVMAGENPLRILGSGKQTRSFLFIDDLVRALLATVTSPHATNMDFNIGSSHEISIMDLARYIWNHAERSDEVSFIHMQSFSADVPRRAADSSRALELLGWTPTVPLDEGLRRYITWFRSSMQ
jgi:UDP-glucose 4-epimerase